MPGKFSSVVKTLSENLLISVYVTLLKWTDQELGSAWLERGAVAAAQHPSHGYRLHIYDGHN